MFGIEHKIAETARKAGMVTASAALTTVGAAFLTAAAWIYLSAEHSPAFAAVVIGLVYFAGGAMTLAIAVSRPSSTCPPEPLPQDKLDGLTPMQLVLVSFLQGFNQGRNTKPPP